MTDTKIDNILLLSIFVNYSKIELVNASNIRV